MKKIYLLLFLTHVSLLFSQGGTPPPPCGLRPEYAIDYDGDGQATFDIDYLVNVYYRNANIATHPMCDFSEVNMVLHKSSDNSIIPNLPYTTSSENVSLHFNYSGTNQLCDFGCSFVISFTSLDTLPVTNDFDNDGVLTINEDLNNNGDLHDDTDLDGIPNFQDGDDDGDGVNTLEEDYNRNGNPQDDDTNSNGIPDYLDSTATLSIAENNFTSFNIYPNPTSDILNIGFANDFAEKITISIYDVTGKLVHNSFEAAKTINISKLNSGIYTLKAEFNETKVIRKLVVM